MPIKIDAGEFLQPSASSLPIQQHVIQIIQHGGSIVFPTETIYGLGALACNADAAARLFAIKGRSPQKPPPVIVGDEQQLQQLVSVIPPHAATLMQRYWPGALTIIFPAHDTLPEIICGKSTFKEKEISTIAVRMTSHPLARQLCKTANAPLIATSANFSGATGHAATPQVLGDIDHAFLQKADVIINGKAQAGEASTIIDCTVMPARVLRHGAIRIDSTDLET